MKRRDFIKTAALGTAALAVSGTGMVSCAPGAPKSYSGTARMKLGWEPYELQLQHTFTVSSYSRTTTPDVQVRIDYDGYVGYGEASMPPYLGHTVESVCAFLGKVGLAFPASISNL